MCFKKYFAKGGILDDLFNAGPSSNLLGGEGLHLTVRLGGMNDAIERIAADIAFSEKGRQKTRLTKLSQQGRCHDASIWYIQVRK